MDVTQSAHAGLVRLPVPAMVELDAADERLIWRWGEQYQWKPVDDKALNVFVSLADAPGERIRMFARRYGPLQLCKHGLPHYHNQERVPPNRRLLWELRAQGLVDDSAWENSVQCNERCEPQRAELPDPKTGATQVWEWEPLEAWRHYAREAKAIRAVAEPVRRGHLAQKARLVSLVDEFNLDFLTGLQRLDNPRAQPVEYVSEWHRSFVKEHLQRWLDMGGIGPRVDWEATMPVLRWEPAGLFGILALRLAAEVALGGHVATCDGCGRTYSRRRAPSRTRRNFCDDCRGRADHKLAMRDLRERRRREKERTEGDEPV